jgi:hypothetical protein
MGFLSDLGRFWPIPPSPKAQQKPNKAWPNFLGVISYLHSGKQELSMPRPPDAAALVEMLAAVVRRL